MTDASVNPDREALESIAGHFLPGDHPQLCYAGAITTLKMIRDEVREALKPHECPDCGTAGSCDECVEAVYSR